MTTRLQIAFADAQIMGPYAFDAYVHEVRDLAPNGFVLTNVIDRSEKSLLSLHAQLSADTIGEFLLATTTSPIDTTRVEFWSSMVSAICAANRLVAYTHVGVMDETVVTPIHDVATVIAMIGSLCDSEADRQGGIEGLVKPDIIDDIAYTIICAMGPFWLEWAMNMGQVAASTRRRDFEMHVRNRRDEATDELAVAAKIGYAKAASLMKACALSFNRLQQASFEKTGLAAEKIRLSPAVLRPKIAAQQAEVLRSRNRDTHDDRTLFAWCKATMTPPEHCVMP